MPEQNETFQEHLKQSGVSRRTFLKFCGMMAGALALPLNYASVIADALAGAHRLPVIWLAFQDCTGDSESFLRAGKVQDVIASGTTDPSVTELLLDYLSLDYHETLMAPSGAASAKSLADTISQNAGGYVVVVEGSIPTAQNGIYCVINGRTAQSILQDVTSKAVGTIAMGACATDGGLAAAAPNPTHAVGVSQAAPGAPNLINLPGCPANVVNLVACLVYYLTFKQWPDLDPKSYKPLFAYGQDIHSNCERKYFYDTGKFVQAWGDVGHQAGWCLNKMGCKGPQTQSNCWNVKWNEGTNWPIGAGHGCIGCAAPGFWDKGIYTVVSAG
jgi:hydrogenase small subunit